MYVFSDEVFTSLINVGLFDGGKEGEADDFDVGVEVQRLIDDDGQPREPP